VLPLHVHQGLGLGAFVVGLVAGAQFGASLISRFWAGHFADTRCAKRATVTGLLVAAVAGLLYLLSLLFIKLPVTSVAILIVGRAVLGGAESFIVTGAFALGLALVGPQNTGTIMAWVGMAMYAAFAIGAPAGTSLYAAYGFEGIALATALIPLVSLLLTTPRRAVASLPHARPAFNRVVGAVWMPGMGLAFSSVGFGALMAKFLIVQVLRHGFVWRRGSHQPAIRSFSPVGLSHATVCLAFWP
jgi:MFS family permease